MPPTGRCRTRELVITAPAVSHFCADHELPAVYDGGATRYSITNPRDIPAAPGSWRKYPFTAMTGVNTLFNALLNNKRVPAARFLQLHFLRVADAGLQQAVAERWVKPPEGASAGRLWV